MHLIIIGLGNPGKKYEHTRHNIGRDIVSAFADANTFPEWEFDKYANALITELTSKNNTITLVLPETYMNNSGTTVAYLAKKYKSSPEQLIVVQDDLDLPFGYIRIDFNRGDGGHNGIKDITKRLKSKSYTRIRFGIIPTHNGALRKPKGEKKILDFVLKPFTNQEQAQIPSLLTKTTTILSTLITHGREHTMNTFNEKITKACNL